jgi:hypothetical protein
MQLVVLRDVEMGHILLILGRILKPEPLDFAIDIDDGPGHLASRIFSSIAKIVISLMLNYNDLIRSHFPMLTVVVTSMLMCLRKPEHIRGGSIEPPGTRGGLSRAKELPWWLGRFIEKKSQQHFGIDLGATALLNRVLTSFSAKAFPRDHGGRKVERTHRSHSLAQGEHSAFKVVRE